jgi:hypothetical protein
MGVAAGGMVRASERRAADTAVDRHIDERVTIEAPVSTPRCWSESLSSPTSARYRAANRHPSLRGPVREDVDPPIVEIAV